MANQKQKNRCLPAIIQLFVWAFTGAIPAITATPQHIASISHDGLLPTDLAPATVCLSGTCHAEQQVHSS
jgi:hypothetical protein